MPAADALVLIRRWLMGIFLLASLGTIAELLLSGHTEEPWQLVPLVLLALACGIQAWAAVSGRPVVVRAFQVLMVGLIASAGIGLWQHLVANVEFEREVRPDLHGWALVWKAVQGVAPPTLAPGAMAMIGLIGLTWTCQHPAFRPVAGHMAGSERES